jgi:asparagine synthase (glutamine-hydrolysing)
LEDNKASSLLSSDAIEQFGYFDRSAVEKLVSKMKCADRLSERENMAVVGVVSTQLLHEHFIRRDWSVERDRGEEDARVINGPEMN